MMIDDNTGTGTGTRVREIQIQMTLPVSMGIQYVCLIVRQSAQTELELCTRGNSHINTAGSMQPTRGGGSDGE